MVIILILLSVPASKIVSSVSFSCDTYNAGRVPSYIEFVLLPTFIGFNESDIVLEVGR